MSLFFQKNSGWDFSPREGPSLACITFKGFPVYLRKNIEEEASYLHKIGFKVFLFIEGLLFLLTLYQLFRNYDLLLITLIGFIMIMLSKTKPGKKNLYRLIGWFMIVLSVLSIFTTWIMVGVIMVYLIMQGGNILENLNLGSLIDVPWKKKRYVGVESREPDSKVGVRRKQQWIGNISFGNDIFEWDDINLSILMGETIIDLGNTLLPDEQNVILIRKGLGHTKIIIPIGVGVSVQHSVLQGNLIFKQETYHLSNETITIVDEDYHTASRKIKIVSSTLMGDVEVIYL